MIVVLYGAATEKRRKKSLKPCHAQERADMFSIDHALVSQVLDWPIHSK